MPEFTPRRRTIDLDVAPGVPAPWGVFILAVFFAYLFGGLPVQPRKTPVVGAQSATSRTLSVQFKCPLAVAVEFPELTIHYLGGNPASG
jgi:hypothetical protein